MDRMNEPASGVSDPRTTPNGGDFEAFFQAEHERLLRALFIVTGSVEEADELMQDAFVAVWERLGPRERYAESDRLPVPDRDEPVPQSAEGRERRRAPCAQGGSMAGPVRGRGRSRSRSPRSRTPLRAAASGSRPHRSAGLRLGGCGPSPPKGGRPCARPRSSSMSDVRRMLERAGEGVSGAPDALERVARRKGRRQRNRRLSAAVVAIAVSMAGVGGNHGSRE